ncbi:DUF3576 domain-containing protein, partial [Marivita sp.]|uniref:DUF3576 domain-containing protein n=1 Tax=Marivita sp. TaxID=2003365 RepID=UPI003F6C8DED
MEFPVERTRHSGRALKFGLSWLGSACMQSTRQTGERGQSQMDLTRFRTGFGVALIAVFVSGCGFFGGSSDREPVETRPANDILDEVLEERRPNRPQSSLFDFFRNRDDAGQVGAVNKYIWNAAIETLDFLPVESVDPFTGV